MFELLIAILLGINNGSRARMKGQNPGLWIFITVICMIITEVMGMFIVLLFFNHGVVDLHALSRANPSSMDQFTQQVADLFYNDVSHSAFILLCSFGGYLLIRYILERMPDKTKDDKNPLQ
jgi:hypothetical protein